METLPKGSPLGNTPPSPLVTTRSPTCTFCEVEIRSSVIWPVAEPLSMPWARLDWIIAETEEFSSVIRRTSDEVGPHEMIWPMTPLEAMTGIPTVSPETEPRLIVTVEVQESLDPEMMRAPFDCRL